jgi:glycosyltransferase involved in cell wall biosynthesis
MFISICIPTYNSGEKLERLLDSVRIQTFKDYEIIVSDDSRNDSVKQIIDSKYADLNIKYYWNETALGTPNNWNNAVAKSNGDWINLLHHDDWYSYEDSLKKFADATKKNDKASLIFCAFENIYLDEVRTAISQCSWIDILLLKWKYLCLYKNFIGNPSCTLVSSKLKPYQYDSRIKWLIDFDFYTWYFSNNKEFTYINEPIISFAIHSSQVTASVKQNPAVEIPESFLLLNKYGVAMLNNIFVYDFFWRLYRNLGLKNVEELELYLKEKCNYDAITKMLKFQQSFSVKYLKKGYISKSLMLISYVKLRLGI